MPGHEVNPDDPRRALEAAGRRCTPQRLAVYDHLRRACHHPTAEEVYLSVRTDLPNISLATIYKALDALVASGLAARLTADGSGSTRFDARGDDHYHLRCLRSGTVEDLATPFDPDLVSRIDPNLQQTLASRGFTLTGYRLELVGYFADAPTSEAADE